MKRTFTLRQVVLAAALGFGLAPVVAIAQQQVNSNAHVSDANNQIGSGGANAQAAPPAAQQNPIPTNIQQQGETNYLANHGLLNNNRINENVRENVNVPNSNGTSGAVSGGSAQSFYVPPNVLSPAATAAPSNMSLSGYLPSSSVDQEDLRIPSLLDSNQYTNPLPKPGELILPGPVDPSAANSAYTNGWSYQISAQQLGLGNDQTSGSSVSNPNQQNSSQNLQTTNNPTLMPRSGNQVGQSPLANQLPTGPVEQARQDIQQQNIQQQIYQMRQDLINSAQQDNGTGNSTNNGNGTSGNDNSNNSNPGGIGSSSAVPTNTPNNQALPTLAVGSTAINSANVPSGGNNFATGQSIRSYMGPMNLPPAWRQSSQFAELRKKLDEYNNAHPLSDEEANRQFRAAMDAYRKAMATTKAPANVATTPPPSPDNGTRGSTVKPLQVQDLATGVNAKGLHDLILQAETLVQTQQYAKALDVYDEAITVDPNYPLLYIGHAEAALGGSSYRQAEADLRKAFTMDKAMLFGQFELTDRLGEQRLQYIQTELIQIASDSPRNPTPVFLLAYIAYNTHHEARAAGYLEALAKRAPNDDLVPLMKQYWTLESAPTTAPDAK